MKKVIGILLLGLLCYYGVRYSGHMNSGTIQVSPPLVSIVNEWKATMNTQHLSIAPFKRIRKIVIVSDSVVDHDAAYCNKITQVIYVAESTVKKGYWSTKAAVWHELGHYIFELEHVDAFDLMNAYSYSEDIYKLGWHRLSTNYLKLCIENEAIARY
jgi:hypothetical protein